MVVLPVTNTIQVQAELDSLGLDCATLAHLKSLSDQETSAGRRGSAFQYTFDGSFPCPFSTPMTKFCSGIERPIPKLTLFVQFEDGIAVDAALTPDTKRYLETLAHKGTPGDSLMGSPEIEAQSSEASGDK
jgi:E3 ubiquitin-protein ligase BAH